MLQYRESTPSGSFVAWGISFEYEYDPLTRRLEVLDTRHKLPLLSFEYCKHLKHLPLNFISTIDKATQIQALMLSADASVALSDIYDGVRLVSFIESAVKLSGLAWELKRHCYRNFSNDFTRIYNLREASICRFEPSLTTKEFYRMGLKSENYTSGRATASTLHKTLRQAADVIVTDMAPDEYARRFEKSAQNLLCAATDLSIISKIIDDDYVPMNKLASRQAHLNNMKNKINQKISFKTIA